MLASKPTQLTQESPGLGRKARDSVLWNTGFMTAINLGQVALALALVRLLTPEIYGQFGLLTAVTGFLLVFSGHVFFEHVVQVRPDETPIVQDTFTAAVAVNVVLFISLNLLAAASSAAPDYAALQMPLHCYSASLLLQPARALRLAVLKRELDWRRVRMLHAAGFALSAVVSVTIAYAGGGIYALIASSLLVPIPYVYDLLRVQGWRPTWAYDRARFRPTMLFGVNRQLCAGLASSRRLIESTFIAQTLGFAVLGVYGRAFGIADIVLGRIVGQSIDAVYPVLTRFERSSERMRRANLLTFRALAWITVPAAALMWILAAPMVLILLGEQWTAVVPLIGWVMLCACLASISAILYRFMLANEQTRHCLYFDLFTFAGGTALLAVLLSGGLVPYLQGLAVLHAAALVLAAAALCARGAMRPRALLAAALAPLPPVAAALLVCHYVQLSLAGELGMLSLAAAAAIAFSVVYALGLRVLSPGQLRELVDYLPLEPVFRRILALR